MKSKEFLRYLAEGKMDEIEREEGGGYLIPETSTIYHKKTTLYGEMCYLSYTFWEFLRTVHQEFADRAEKESNKAWDKAHDEEEINNIEMLRGLANFGNEPE